MTGSKYNVRNWIGRHASSDHFKPKITKNVLNTSETKTCGVTADHVAFCRNYVDKVKT